MASDPQTTGTWRRIVFGAAFAAAIAIGFPFAMGWTFGQRCSVLYPAGGEAWNSCVQELAYGR